MPYQSNIPTLPIRHVNFQSCAWPSPLCYSIEVRGNRVRKPSRVWWKSQVGVSLSEVFGVRLVLECVTQATLAATAAPLAASGGACEPTRPLPVARPAHAHTAQHNAPPTLRCGRFETFKLRRLADGKRICQTSVSGDRSGNVASVAAVEISCVITRHVINIFAFFILIVD